MKPNQSMQANLCPFRCLIHNTFTKFARAATNAALILSRMLCRSGDSGTGIQTQSQTQSATQSFSVAHIKHLTFIPKTNAP